ncbi:MAG: S8 family serine peptidase, partial [Candidatus Heimdallarchaeaceae archaeon]
MLNLVSFGLKILNKLRIRWGKRRLPYKLVFFILSSLFVAFFVNTNIPSKHIIIITTDDVKPLSPIKVLSYFDFISSPSVLYGTSEDNTDTVMLYQGSNDKLDWGVDDIDAEKVWGGTDGAVDVLPESLSGEGVSIAIIDTGIDKDHPDLNDNYAGGYNCIKKDGELWDPSYTKDEFGHGTHVAGIIAAEDNDEGVIGVAPHASLYALRAFDASAQTEPDYILRALNWCIQT